jgi:hypothetical protein
MALTDNLVSYYTMADLTTSTIEDVHGSNDGTKKGANEPNQVDGKIGKAQDFDGSNDYISFDSSISFTDAFSFSMWMRMEGDNSVTVGSLALQNPYVRIEVASERISVSWNKVTTRPTTDDFALDETFFFTFVRDEDDEVKIYKNAVEVVTPFTKSGTVVFTALGTKEQAGGGYPSWMNGWQDEVGFWSRALTQDEITALYNGGNGIVYEAYTEATNDDSIPDLEAGKYLWCKQVLSTTDTDETPKLTNLEIEMK